MRVLVVTLAAMLLAAGPAGAQVAATSGLTNLLEAELARFVGPGGPYKGGVYIKNLATGEQAAVNADDHFETASTFKLVVMVMAFQLAEQGKLDLNARYTIRASDIRGGSGIFQYHDLGLQPTLRDMITQMVITSDNTATDIMIAKVGGKDAVNLWLKANGYSVFHVQRTIFEAFRSIYELDDPKNKDLTPEQLYTLMHDGAAFDAMYKRIGKDLVRRAEDENNMLAVVTPAEMGRLLEGIERETIASKRSCEEMKRIMLAQQAGARKIPHFLNVPVAHKTGEYFGVTNDVGIVYAKSGPIIVALYSMGYTGLEGEADDRLGAIARLVVAYFDGAPG
jgi:beta-lactamase class A